MNRTSDALLTDLEYAGRPCRKRSESKATWPGRKQVSRRIGTDGYLNGDIITVEGDCREGEPLLGQVMQGGTRVASPPSVEEIRRHARLSLTQLPDPLHRIDRADPYEVRIAPTLTELAEQVDSYT